MNVKELNKSLRKMAIDNGLCSQWQKDWEKDWNAEKLVSKFYRGMDFYLENRFIPTEFIKENVDISFLRSNGILADDNYSLINPSRAILIGNSESTIRMNGTNVATVYAVDDAHMKIIARNNSFILVHALDRAIVETEQFNQARIVVILHSHDAQVKGDATIKEEFDYLK